MKSQAPVRARQGRPKSQEKGDAILRRAADLFLEKGFNGTSMDDVATAAGVSKQTVYSHFGNKEDLYRAVIIGKCRQYRLREDDLPRAADVGEGLRMIGEHYLALICDPEVVAMYRVVIAESISYPIIAQLFHQAGPAPGHRAMARFIEEHAVAGNLVVDHAERAAEEFLCLLRGTHQYALMLGLRPTPDESERRAHVDLVVGHFLALYGRQRIGAASAGL